MRVISMVPSWTETLIEAGIEVVGRTRYCLHPEDKVKSIPVVGGTKDVDWDAVIELNPDLILFDQEENPLEMAEACEFPFFATHVRCLKTLQQEFERLGDLFKNEQLILWAVDLLDVLNGPRPQWSNQRIPGLLENVLPAHQHVQNHQGLIYVIWRNPWMAANKDTFIASVLEFLGGKLYPLPPEDKYPIIELEECRDAFVLYSSEPFPFAKKVNELKKLPLRGAVVDGECFSWFGVRTLRFLQQQQQAVIALTPKS
ncbi:MAG: helical backbone metal receptor [Bdellovibrionia bacterium]